MKNVFFWTLALAAIALLLYMNFFKSSGSTETPEIIFTPFAPKPIGPYSQAVSRGNAVFVSGQIALDPESGRMDTAHIEIETERVLKNIAAILEAVQLKMTDVVKATVYVTSLEHFAGINNIYGKYFLVNPPARETVQVVALPKGAHVEISVVAIKK